MYAAKDFRKAALVTLRGKWGLFIVLSVFCTVISNLFTIENPQVASVKHLLSTIDGVWSLFWYPICTVAFTYLFILAIRNRPIKFRDVFYYRTSKEYWKILGVGFVSGILTFLWSLLLIVPGIIKTYAYVMAPYIMLDQHVGITESITRSRKMMDGYKWRFFCLQISFLGWAILATIPLGLGWLWLIPYYKMATAHFYEYVANRHTNNLE